MYSIGHSLLLSITLLLMPARQARKSKGSSRIRKRRQIEPEEPSVDLEKNTTVSTAISILSDPTNLDEKVASLLSTTSIGIKVLFAGIAQQTSSTLSSMFMTLDSMEKELSTDKFQQDLPKSQKIQLYRTIRDTFQDKLEFLRQVMEKGDHDTFKDEIMLALRSVQGTEEHQQDVDHHDITTLEEFPDMEKSILSDLRNIIQDNALPAPKKEDPPCPPKKAKKPPSKKSSRSSTRSTKNTQKSKSTKSSASSLVMNGSP